MATPLAIQGVSYAKITQTVHGEIYDLIPFDLNGNLFREVTIECDTTNLPLTINLPEISTLNGNYNTSIRIISLNAGDTGNIVSIDANLLNNNLIGSNAGVQLEGDGSNIILTPVSPTEWYGVIAI